jgi:cysteinyl-tRNA synthetase
VAGPALPRAPGHAPAASSPSAGNKDAVAEGEGVLTNEQLAAAAEAASEPMAAGGVAVSTHTISGALNVGGKDKRNECDFALWKKSKDGEPWWDSPWGPGRPGWHIECSSMCAETLGRLTTSGSIDIHSGGVDLRFPHHDNEIAQSEAFYDGDAPWVHYFLHSGHLHIDGMKMSKSLKNFIKIRAALDKYGPRQLRLLFLMFRYDAPMDYSEAVMEHAAAADKTFSEFFLNVKAELRRLPAAAPAKWSDRDTAYADKLTAAQVAVHAALCDNFDTPQVLHQLKELVRETNVYLKPEMGAAAAAAAAAPTVNAYLLRSVAGYVHRMFVTFGLIDPLPALGFPVAAAGGAGGDWDPEVKLGPYLSVLSGFRDVVRAAAKARDTGAVLTACDRVRDVDLPPLGVVLEDAAGGGREGSSVWKLRDPADIRREMEERERAVEEKRRAKEAEAARARRDEEDKIAAASVPPADYFRAQAGKFTHFDAAGLPTHDAKGDPIPDKKRDKLRKEADKQAKAHDWFLALDPAKRDAALAAAAARRAAAGGAGDGGAGGGEAAAPAAAAGGAGAAE